jgi:4a-hydroxytetrahydrobiopterin dehydratase
MDDGLAHEHSIERIAMERGKPADVQTVFLSIGNGREKGGASMAQETKQEVKLPVLADDVIEKRLQEELPGWWYEGRWIRRKYNTDGWLTTLALVNTIGYLAEAAWHHPDLEVTWGKVWVKLRNHASNGITDRDFELAKRIEEVVLWKPISGSVLEGTPNKWVRGGSPDKPA